MEKSKSLTCGQCLKQAVDIQLGVSDKNWNALGSGKAKCGPCLQTVIDQFSETDTDPDGQRSTKAST